MNSENEKLRGLLQQALDMLEEQALHIEAEMQPSGNKLLNQIRAALSQQAEPAAAQDERDAVYRDAELYGIGFMVDGVRVHPRRVTVQYSAARPAQNEQKPGLRHTDQWESARVADYNAGWNDRHKAEFSRLTDDQIFDIAEPFGEFRYGDAQGDRRLAFARAIIAAAAAPIAQTEQWISVDERLPESERTVLAFYLNSLGKGRRVRAEYIAAKTKSADDGWDSDEPADYDEQADEYFWPAGWYEVMDNWDDLTHMVIHEGEVTHWLPLPAAPTP